MKRIKESANIKNVDFNVAFDVILDNLCKQARVSSLDGLIGIKFYIKPEGIEEEVFTKVTAVLLKRTEIKLWMGLSCLQILGGKCFFQNRQGYTFPCLEVGIISSRKKLFCFWR